MKKIAFLLCTLALNLSLKAEEAVKTAITTTNPFYGSIEKFSAVLGTFEASKELTLKAEAPGTLAAIHFKDGATVQKGDLLISMDDTIAKAHYTQSQAAHTLAADNLARAQKLIKTGTLSKQAFEEAISQEKDTASAMAVAKAELDHTHICAPFEGTIGFKTERTGTFVDVGTPLVTIVDLTPLDIEFYVPENYVPYIKLSQKVFVQPFFKHKNTFEASVTSIDARLDANHQLKVRAQLLKTPQNIYPGHSAKVNIALESHPKALLVPLMSLRIKEKASYAFKIDKDMVRETKVKIGLRQNEWVEILKGLTDKDIIAYEGAFKLSDGEPVSVKSHKALKKAG